MKEETIDRTKETIEGTADLQPQWTSLEWKDLRSLKVTFNMVSEMFVKLLKKDQIDLEALSEKITGSILKKGCDGSSLPYDLKQEAKTEHAIVIKLRKNKIKVFDFDQECTLCIPIDSTFSRKFHEFSKMIVQQAAA